MRTVLEKFSVEQKQKALEKVLESTTFARADQLRRFLRYICEMEMAGRAGDISEYSIATEAMGRSRGYSPGDDSSVRSRTHALRQKLQEYYESEQPDAPLKIELRKGSYVPFYVERPEPEPAPTPAPVSIPVVEQPIAKPQQRWWLLPAAIAATAIVTAALMFLIGRQRFDSAAVDANVQAAWGPMLEQHAQVLVCMGSPPAMLLKSFRQGTVPASPRLLPTPC